MLISVCELHHRMSTESIKKEGKSMLRQIIATTAVAIIC